MTIEKDPTEELRRLVLGDTLATNSDIEEFEALAYAAIEGAPVSTIREIEYSVAPGYLGLMLVEEDDLPAHKKPTVVLSMHAGDTDNPYFSVTYDSDNRLCDLLRQADLSTVENVFWANSILYELLTNYNGTPLSFEEIKVIARLQAFIKSIEGINDDSFLISGPTIHFADVVREIVRDKCIAVQSVREIGDRLPDGREIGIVTASYEPMNGVEILAPESQFPLLQVNLKDTPARMISYYLSLATGVRECDSAPIRDEAAIDNKELYAAFDDTIETQAEADEIISNTMRGIDKDTLDKLTLAVLQLSVAE